MFQYPLVHGASLSTAYGFGSHMSGTKVRRRVLLAAESRIQEIIEKKHVRDYNKCSGPPFPGAWPGAPRLIFIYFFFGSSR